MKLYKVLNFQLNLNLEQQKQNQIFKHYVINIEENFRNKFYKKNKVIYK